MKKLLTIFSIGLALMLSSCSSSNTPSARAQEIYDLLAEGDYAAAFECFDLDDEDPETKEAYMAMMTEKVAPSIEKKGGISKAEVASEELDEDGQGATVYMNVTYGNGSVEEDSIDMVLDDEGQWKAELAK